jgi:hypothetical protein
MKPHANEPESDETNVPDWRAAPTKLELPPEEFERSVDLIENPRPPPARLVSALRGKKLEDGAP